MLTKLRSIAAKLAGLVYPPTKAKLHRLITVAGVLFAAAAEAQIVFGDLGLTTTGRVVGAVGTLATLLAGWKRAQPKLDAAVNALPIPDGEGSAK